MILECIVLLLASWRAFVTYKTKSLWFYIYVGAIGLLLGKMLTEII